jgi:RNA polymerase sigma-70 factor (ECF subfamily)
MPNSAPTPQNVSFAFSPRYGSHNCDDLAFAAILPSTSGEVLELFAFDEAYLVRHREGDPSTEAHFVAYFSHLLRIKLRARYLAPEIAEDLSQETFGRVLKTLRRDGGLRDATRLGAFVNSVCNHVLLEHFRAGKKDIALDPSHSEIPDKVINLESLVISLETQIQVRKLLAQLPPRDQAILRAVFLDEHEKEEVCGRFGVSRDYLRVLIHRAKQKLRAQFGT